METVPFLSPSGKQLGTAEISADGTKVTVRVFAGCEEAFEDLMGPCEDLSVGYVFEKKAKRKYAGRRPVLDVAAVVNLRARVALGIPKSEVAKEFKISRATLYKYLKSERGTA